MNKTKYFKTALFTATLFLGAALSSCADDIKSGTLDEGPFEGVNRVEGMLFDQNSNKNESIVELRSDKYQTDVYFALTKAPGKGVDVTIKFDPAYLETYNAAHGTDFKLFPAESVTIERDGVLLLAPDEKRSASVGITLTGSDQLQEDVTYAIPLSAVSTTEGITLSESARHAIYLVKDLRKLADTYKGPDAVKTVLYFEVNDANPLNALEFVLKDSGKLFFDEVVLFSANINYDAEKNRVYVFNNENVQFLLDNNETYLQPLRKRGMKVILGILGNHDAAGVAQLSDIGARQFAQELATYCYAYNLDGVGFDDEYSNSPDLGNPLFTSRSGAAASRLFYETKKAMPDKTVMIYYWGSIWSSVPAIEGVQPSEFVDYAVADYGGAAAPVAGMTIKNCAGMSIELAKGRGNSSESFARQQKNAGYGYYMFFALDPKKYGSQVSRCQSVSKGLYEEELLFPEYFYAKNNPVRQIYKPE